MLKAISSRVKKFEKLPENTQELHRTALSRSMAVEYVHRSNIGESVGTQAFEDIQTLLKDEPVTLSDREQSQWSRDELETVNTWRALRKFHQQIREEMQRTGMLTAQQLCDIHKLLLERLHPNNGKIRDTDVFTRTKNGIHYYPCAMVAKQQLYSLIDHHNIRMERYHTYRERMSTEEKVEFIVKCAARLLFEFVDTHPFSDGNGRTCRLLASYVLSLVIPFPVAVYHNPNQPQRSHRDDFIDAIVRCRKNPMEGPRELAAMILEGIYLGWENPSCSNLVVDARGEARRSLTVPSQVAQKSALQEIWAVGGVVKRVVESLPSVQDISSLKLAIFPAFYKCVYLDKWVPWLYNSHLQTDFFQLNYILFPFVSTCVLTNVCAFSHYILDVLYLPFFTGK